jgi:hypothetical protein
MKWIVLLALAALSFCGCGRYEGNVLYENGKCVIIRVNDSMLVLAPGISSDSRVESKVVFINGEHPARGANVFKDSVMRKNRFSEDFRRADSAFVETHPGVTSNFFKEKEEGENE